MKAPLRYASFVAGAWLVTLGACGRTLPLTDDNQGYVDVSGDDDTSNGGTGNRTSTGGGRTGGSSNGGTLAQGGAGGTRTGGGTGGTRTGGGTGGSVNTGGSGGDVVSSGGTGDRGTGGTFGRGGSGNGGTGGGRSMGGRSAGGTAGASGMGALAGMENTAGAPNLFPNITCDGALCDPATSVCCKRRGSQSTCELIENGCSSGATLSCSGSGQCGPAQVCCFQFNASSCADSCAVSVGSPGVPPTVILCDSNADCAADEICVIAPRGIAYCASAVQ